ncbi:MAG: hypothetical protein ACPG4X_14800 [Pikeienuella sp.]
MSYSYIERIYGRKFEAGQRVVFTEYDKKPGHVKGVRGDPQYVSVRFDDGTEGECHPMSVEPVKTVFVFEGEELELS